MENKQRQILSEINDMAASIRSQLEMLENKILELDQMLGVEPDTTPIEVDFDDMEIPVIPEISRANDVEPIESEPVPEDTPAPEVEVAEPAAETSEPEMETVPEVEMPEPEVEIVPEEEAPVETEPEMESSPEVESAPAVEDLPEEAPALVLDGEDDLPESAVAPIIAEQAAAPTIADQAAETPSRRAVIDAMAEHQAWRTDMPGSPVRDIRSAISLNDRLFFINSLFNRDAVLFQNTICALNSMNSLDEAVEYLSTHETGWNFESDGVYRFMMAVRRRLK